MSQALHFTIDGHEINTQNIFIGIQRARLPLPEQINHAFLSGEVIAIPVRFLGQWEILVARVKHLVMFPQGMILFINTRHKGSVLQNWPNALMWIPSSPQEMAGVLHFVPGLD